MFLPLAANLSHSPPTPGTWGVTPWEPGQQVPATQNQQWGAPCGACSAVSVSPALAFEAEGARRQQREPELKVLEVKLRGPLGGRPQSYAHARASCGTRGPGDSQECPRQPEARPARGPTPWQVATTPDHSLFPGGLGA